ncbi:hypothetical protein BUALT_Bualt09G0055200 [Buddleja alternifolia]|uniref:DUF4283 domain-containing protein n=1 Tax=Buddleja alternifolia TaxID=168488 RepID=A0AAV6X6W0_9LAMI|nr:hypothetical protein BUALT_Bualt09G0055200 [Buddleja alternifolia]
MGSKSGSMEGDIDRMADCLSLSDVEGGQFMVPYGIWGVDNKIMGLGVVGRLLTNRRYNFGAIKETFLDAFNPVRGMEIKQIENNRLLFIFNHEVDRDRVFTKGPWNFRKELLVLKILGETDDPVTTNLDWNDMYVQVKGLPVGKGTDKLAEFIGNNIGIFKEGELEGPEQNWGILMRIRVSLNITKPLPRFMPLCSPEGEEIRVTFSYEKLANFCYFCGMLDHLSDYCGLRYKEDFVNPGKNTPFGPELRAPPPRRFPPPTSQTRRSEGLNWRWSNSGSRSDGEWRPRHGGSLSHSSHDPSLSNSLARFRSPQMNLSPFINRDRDHEVRDREESGETNSSPSTIPEGSVGGALGTVVPNSLPHDTLTRSPPYNCPLAIRNQPITESPQTPNSQSLNSIPHLSTQANILPSSPVV